jgi:hypothetical protein
LAPWTLLNGGQQQPTGAVPNRLRAKLAFWQRVRADYDYDPIRGLHKVGRQVRLEPERSIKAGEEGHFIF